MGIRAFLRRPSRCPSACFPSSKRSFGALRPGHVYWPTAAPSDSRAHTQFARDAAAGRGVVPKSPGTQLRSYIFGTDCAAALLLMLEGEPGEAYNVGDPLSACTVRELAEAFAAAGGVGVARDYPTAAELAGYNPMGCSALDCSKLAGLGFRCATGLEEGARLNVECWRG